MNPRQALRVREKATQSLTRAVLRAINPFLGRKLTRDMIAELNDASRPLVLAARGLLLASANQQYRDFVEADPLAPPVLDRFNADSWEGTLLKVTGLDQPTQTELALTTDHLESVVKKADYWARDAERGALIDYARRDSRIERWARIDPEPPSCPFCTVLISRGAVYTSKDSAGMDDQAKFHTGCTCTAVLVAPGELDSYEGVEYRDAALAEYKKAVNKAGGHTGLTAVIKAMKEERGKSEPKEKAVNPEQAKAQALAAQESKLAQARARKKTLDSMNPSSAQAKAYKATQLKRENKLIAELGPQIKNLKGEPS